MALLITPAPRILPGLQLTASVNLKTPLFKPVLSVVAIEPTEQLMVFTPFILMILLAPQGGTSASVAPASPQVLGITF